MATASMGYKDFNSGNVRTSIEQWFGDNQIPWNVYSLGCKNNIRMYFIVPDDKIDNFVELVSSIGHKARVEDKSDL